MTNYLCPKIYCPKPLCLTWCCISNTQANVGDW